MKMERGK